MKFIRNVFTFAILSPRHVHTDSTSWTMKYNEVCTEILIVASMSCQVWPASVSRNTFWKASVGEELLCHTIGNHASRSLWTASSLGRGGGGLKHLSLEQLVDKMGVACQLHFRPCDTSIIVQVLTNETVQVLLLYVVWFSSYSFFSGFYVPSSGKDGATTFWNEWIKNNCISRAMLCIKMWLVLLCWWGPAHSNDIDIVGLMCSFVLWLRLLAHKTLTSLVPRLSARLPLRRKEGGYYIRGRHLFLWKSRDINDGWIRYVQVRWQQLLDAVSSTHNLSVLLSAVGMTCTTQTVLALAWWPSSAIIRTWVHVPHLLAMATIQGWYLFRSRASDCAATIRGWQLLEIGVYLKKYSILSMENMTTSFDVLRS